MKQTFAQLLAQYIDESGMKQKHIASSAQISNNYLLRLLGGERHPSEQAVSRIAKAMRLSPIQTGALLAAAGYTPPLDLLQPFPTHEQAREDLPLSEESPITFLIKQFYHLAQEVPEPLQAAFQVEMRQYLAYARYRYVLCGGASLLDLEFGTFHPDPGSKSNPESDKYS